MASKLQEEVICPICMDILQDPVTIDCGHNFCLGCISEVGKAADTLLCPLCNASVNRNTFRFNKLLANLTEKVQAMEVEEAELRCQRHKEKLHYFCEQDGEFLCVVCRDSKDHKAHDVSLIEEAAQTYQGKIQSQVDILGQQEKKILQEIARGENLIQVFKTQVHLDRLKVLYGFKRLRQSLEKEETFLLAKLGWLELEGTKKMNGSVTVTQEQLHTLRELIESLNTKQQMPPRQLLQDIKTTLSRSERFQFINLIPGNMAEDISEEKSRHVPILKSLKEFKDKLQDDGKKDKSRFLDSLKEEDKKSWYLFEKNNAESPTSAPVTLDASSAHPDLTLSQDLKNVWLFETTVQPKDPNRKVDPQRFYPLFCVLGLPGICSGQRIWEVQIQRTKSLHKFSRGCLVGVASELVPRQGLLQVKPLNGFWALNIHAFGCTPLIDSGTPKTLLVSVVKVGVYVDHDCGEVIFYDATTNKHIYTFHASFTGKIFPFFQLLDPHSQIALIS